MSVEVVAEVGVNHQGDRSCAERMIRQVSASGASAVKFQTFSADSLARIDTPKAAYQQEHDLAASHLEMLKSLELSRGDHEHLFVLCRELGIEFMSTPYGIDDAAFLDRLGVRRFKTSSADIIDLPLHHYLASTGKPVLIATGMASDGEIEQALTCYGDNLDRLTLMHAVSMYPTPIAVANLKRIRILKETYDVRVGFSDHTIGGEAAKLAVALGAEVIEKHVTESLDLPGPDHAASLVLDDLSGYVEAIIQAEEAVGDGHAIRTPEEEEFAGVARKSPYLAKPIEIGQRLTERHICLQRPGTGETYASIAGAIGRFAVRSLPSAAPLHFADFEEYRE